VSKRKSPQEKKREAEIKAAQALDRAASAMHDLLSACIWCGERVGEAGDDSRIRLESDMRSYADYLLARIAHQ
jgi:hypothetical protein